MFIRRDDPPAGLRFAGVMRRAAPVMIVLAALAALPRHPYAADMPHMQHAGTTASPHFALGPRQYKISTRSAAAQAHFNDGLNWVWAFNLQEAQRSFEAAAKADSNCAMCWWGVALSLGPHINVPAIPERTVAADHAVKRAVALEANASESERALIDALTHRYSDPAPTDPAVQHGLDQGYADAMRAVAKRFPNDMDIQSLFVEALLDLRPWDYWTADGKPQPGTDEILSTLETVLRRDPRHPGANHYYIHALEASPHPEKALDAANRLGTLMPASGHLTHMPFHIYLRVGSYAKAEEANRKAVDADLAYAGKVEVPMFMHMYTAHDFQSLSFCQMMQGKSASSIRNAREAEKWVPVEFALAMPGVDFFLASSDMMLARFGRWDDILAAPPPPAGLPYLAGVRHYVRGLAYAGKGDPAKAHVESDSVAAIMKALPPDAIEDLNPTSALLNVALHSLNGEIALAEKRTDEALAALRLGVAAEDSLHYSEPPDWMNSVRLQLGDALLNAGNSPEAEVVYRAHLERHPNDPWGLNGLAQSLERQSKSAEAKEAQGKFTAGWATADVKLKGSKF